MTWTIIINMIDIAIVSVIIYYILHVISGTRAVQLIKGLVLIFGASLISQVFNLNTVNWFLKSVLTMVFVALPIVFQPELRRALEQLGRGGFLKKPINNWGPKEINELVSGVTALAECQIGALIVIEKTVGLRNYIETGVKIDALLSKELLQNIFTPGAPLHDGAVIIDEGKIISAGCFLPLTTRTELNPKLGTRHRAAIGITEESDALTIVVSEESGVISIAKEGDLNRYLDKSNLREHLFNELEVMKEKSFNWRNN